MRVMTPVLVAYSEDRTMISNQLLTPLLLIVSLLGIPVIAYASEDTIKNAKQLFSSGKTTDAITVLKKLNSDTSDLKKRAELQNAIGWALLKNNDYSAAQTYLNSALNIANAGHFNDIKLTASNNLGIALYLQNNFAASRKYFSQDYAKDSVTAQNYLHLLDVKENEFLTEQAILSGINKRQNRQFEQAIVDYDNALKHKPNDARTLEFKGYAQYRLGLHQQAYETLHRSREIDPNHQFTHLNLLKVSCSMNSSAKIRHVISDSGIKKAVFQKWMSVDNELQEVCGENKTVLSILGVGKGD
jgi:Flp pilus assembly protein TadD